MAVPKKKTSVSRRGKRRAGQHHKLYAKDPMSCPNCGALAMMHMACPSCGTYKGREVFTVKVQAEEDEESTETTNI